MRGAARATLLLTMCRAFYLPGVAPRTFRYGDKVELKVNKLTSVDREEELSKPRKISESALAASRAVFTSFKRLVAMRRGRGWFYFKF